jgi:AraC-like DNA-binding protein
LFFNSNEPYRVSHPIAGGDDCTTFSFDRGILLDALAGYEPGVLDRAGRPFPVSHSLLEPRDVYFRQRLRQRIRCGDTEALAIEEMALDLLHAVVEMAYRARGQRPVKPATGTARIHRDQAEATKAFLAGRLQTPLALPEIARAVHTSPYHLARLFRRETGIPIHQYLNRLRLGLALERLADGVAGLTELALDLGYSSHSHFSEAFRQAFGTSPSAFRKQMSKNPKA